MTWNSEPRAIIMNSPNGRKNRCPASWISKLAPSIKRGWCGSKAHQTKYKPASDAAAIFKCFFCTKDTSSSRVSSPGARCGAIESIYPRGSAIMILSALFRAGYSYDSRLVGSSYINIWYIGSNLGQGCEGDLRTLMAK